MSPEELAGIRRRIAARKEDRARAEGAVRQLESRLPAEFGVADEAEAEKALAELGESIAGLNTRIAQRRTEIEADLVAMGL